MQQVDFAAVVSHSDAAGLVASHVPVLMARGNSHWRLMEEPGGVGGQLSGASCLRLANLVRGVASSSNVGLRGRDASGAARVREDTTFIAGVVEDLTRRYEDHREHRWSKAVPKESYALRYEQARPISPFMLTS